MSKVLTSGVAALIAFLAAAPALAADVTVSVKGVRAANGPLYISLQTRDEFMKDDGSYGEIIKSPSPGVVSVTLPNVAPGQYAVSVWHDIDGDGVFDAAANGSPLDGWAMIDAASLRAAPAFDQVSFKIEKSSVSVDVDMIYAE
ncbi:MAG: DUF2141 domain-containing protein [Parvularculaceae bacterium]